MGNSGGNDVPDAKADAEKSLDNSPVAKSEEECEAPKVPARRLSGKKMGEAGKPYEQKVREFTGGKSQIIEGREIDSATDNALIQAKDSESAVTKPHNFLNQKTRTQIKVTKQLAEKEGKTAEFWFKQKPHSQVVDYIKGKGLAVKVWSGEMAEIPAQF